MRHKASTLYKREYLITKKTDLQHDPLHGEIIAFNEALEDEPEKVNSDPYGEGWMIKIKVSDPSQFDTLLSDADYKDLVGG